MQKRVLLDVNAPAIYLVADHPPFYEEKHGSVFLQIVLKPSSVGLKKYTGETFKKDKTCKRYRIYDRTFRIIFSYLFPVLSITF